MLQYIIFFNILSLFALIFHSQSFSPCSAHCYQCSLFYFCLYLASVFMHLPNHLILFLLCYCGNKYIYIYKIINSYPPVRPIKNDTATKIKWFFSIVTQLSANKFNFWTLKPFFSFFLFFYAAFSLFVYSSVCSCSDLLINYSLWTIKQLTSLSETINNFVIAPSR